MKKRNKEKRSLTAVGAVVAAGLTPGFIAASAAGSCILSPNSGITAAEVVAIDGQAYSFEELYAKQHPDSVEMNVDLPEVLVQGLPHTTKYGGPWGIGPKPYDYDCEVIEGDTIYRSVDRAPQFPGGDAALMEYIDSHIQYPASAILNKVQGCVVVKFVVENTGKIGAVKVVLSVDKELNKEAVRICKSLPNFIPARRNGQAVSVWHTVQVIFKLPQENND